MIWPHGSLEAKRIRKRSGSVCLGVAACLLAMGALASSALASEGIESFVTTTSTTQAGGHPNLTTSFKLENPGAPEAAQNVIFNAPQGVFGNPNAINECALVEFALDQCPSVSQAGLVTLHANYKGSPNYLLGTAPLYDVVPSNGATAEFAFIVPMLNIPISIPVAVRTASDYGLRFTVKDITQLTPLAAAELTFWGFPAESGHDQERFPRGAPGNPAGCVERSNTSCIGEATPASIPVHPLTDNPTTCTENPLATSLEVQTYHDPADSSRQESSYPRTEGCEKETFYPVLYASPTTDQTDSATGVDVELTDPQPLGFSASPSELKEAIVSLPAGFTINPDAADGQSACTDAQGNFKSEGPAECPDDSKIGTFSIGTKALSGPLQGSVFIGEPEQGDQYRLFLTASGFGINAKLVGMVRPNPETGQLTVEFPELPQAPFDEFQLHLFSGERSLMATPLSCTVYTTSAEFYPWDAALAEQESSQSFGLQLWSKQQPVPRSSASIQPEPGSRHDGSNCRLL